MMKMKNIGMELNMLGQTKAEKEVGQVKSKAEP
jgi:hypothetical protein